MVIGEINRFLHIYWNAEYANRVGNDVAFRLVIASKFVMFLIAIFVAYFDPSILMCDSYQFYVCTREATASIRIISMGFSFVIMVTVSFYFVRKVYSLSKVHPHPVIAVATINSEEPNGYEENAIRRLNQNPNQFFKVKILKAIERSPAQTETIQLLSIVKKAFIVNIVTLCQFASLFPMYMIDILLLFNVGTCDDDYFVVVLKLLGLFGLFGYLSFPICLGKKLDKFSLH